MNFSIHHNFSADDQQLNFHISRKRGSGVLGAKDWYAQSVQRRSASKHARKQNASTGGHNEHTPCKRKQNTLTKQVNSCATRKMSQAIV